MVQLKGIQIVYALKEKLWIIEGSFLRECQYTDKQMWFSEVSRHVVQGRGWRQQPGTGRGLGLSIINLILLQTQSSPLLTNPPASSGRLKGVTWTHTSNSASPSLSTYWSTQQSLVVTRSPLMINWSLFHQTLISVSVAKPLWNFFCSHRGNAKPQLPGLSFQILWLRASKVRRFQKNYCVKVCRLCTESSMLCAKKKIFALLPHKQIRVMSQEEQSVLKRARLLSTKCPDVT